MIFFYLFAILPVVVGFALWYQDKNVVWWEWLVGSAVAFVVAAGFHGLSIWGMTSDQETWSGFVKEATYYPKWIEEYQEAIYKTVTRGSGKNRTTERVFSHYETRHRTHNRYWELSCTVNGQVNIDEELFDVIRQRFGNAVETKKVYKSGFDSGDPNIYVAHNATGYIFPTNTWRQFENRVKAAPSVFSYSKVPKDIRVFEYPRNKDFMHSDRLIGTSVKTIDLYLFDKMNTELGPNKKVNVLMIGFGSDADSLIGQWQEAKYIGGRKNDLVLCYGGGTDTKPQWAKVFGWTEKEIVKRNLETILLNNTIDNKILPLIRQEIEKSYTIKDWHKFDYITIEPPTWCYFVYVLVMILIQCVFWYFAHNNDESKGGRNNRYGYRY